MPCSANNNMLSHMDSKNHYFIYFCLHRQAFEVELTGLSSLTNPYVSLDYFVGDTSWESNDALSIWVEWSGGSDVAVDTTGTDLDDYGWEGSWQTVMMDLSDAGNAASLRVEFTANTNEELIYLDNIQLLADP